MTERRTATPATLTDLLFAKADVGLCLVAPDGTVVRANAEWLRSTRFTEERVAGERIVDLFPETRDMALALHARARAGHRVEVPRHAQSVNGVETWWEGSIEPVPMDGGTGLLITAREVAPLAAGPRPGAWPAPGPEILQGIIEGTTDLVAALDLEFRYVAFNRAYADEFSAIFGRAIRVGDSMLEALAHLPRDQANAKEIWGRALAGETFTVVQEFGDERRARKRFELRYRPIRDASGIIGASHVVRDVTEMRLVQEALQESEERYRTLFTSMTEGFALGEAICGAGGAPVDFRFLQMNDAFERQSGLRRSDVLGRAMREVLPNLEQAWVDRYCGVALSGEPVRFEQYNRDLDRHFSVYCYSPSPGRFATLFTDVTEANRRDEAKARDRERLVEALRTADEDRRTLVAVLDALPAGVAIADATGRVTHVNAALGRIWGAPPMPRSVDEYREWRGWWVETGEPIAGHEWAMARALSTGEVVKGDVVEIEKSDGSGNAIIINAAAPIRNAQGQIVGGALAAVDITEQRRAEQALRVSEERLRLALEAARMVAWEYDPATKRVTFSGNASEVLAVRSGRVHDDSDQGYALIHPDDVERHQALVTAAIEEAGSYVSVYRQVADGEVLWMEERGRAVAGASGKTVRLVGVCQNITERKRAEEALREANERLREADRRKDDFLGMLSHELRNPLAPIRTSTYILQHAPSGAAQARRAVTVIQRQTEHLTRLVDDLLDVTRIARGKIELRPERVDLRAVVLHAGDDFRLTMQDRGVAFRTAVPDAEVWADADATRVAQLVGNLLHNAAKFTRRGDEVTLALAAEGGEATIRVRDTGAGIAPELLPRVFEPFVQGERTLARTEGGLGLGLALVKAIAELHGGTVRAVSAGKGRGAEFVVRLPVGAELPSDEAAGRGLQRGGGRRVLVVDDNVDAAESLADIVAMLGHAVEIALDGPSALEKARASAPEIVLCDLGLPGMSGYEVARALREAGDAVQLFAVSGYAQPEDVRRALEAGFDGHLAKPLRFEDLERLLAS